MPIYEYECGVCGHTFEAFQKMVDAPLKECPECKKAALKKLISASAFRLKGDGWYETDFKTGSKKNLAGKESGKSDSKSSSEPKSESKA
ncbi:Type I antifreeze protein [hydrothermal vent metagenome]|uniref:Type I antifreeze protein n=1 Tax=hydrothermal vent metagenome TaxID=652676 RepID=A0A3B0ZR10_9ZZZZ